MDYTTAVPFDGKTAAAFDLAAAALTSLGFRIVARDDSSLDASGPGMTSTREGALLGASRIRVTRKPRELAVDAELGGVRRMKRFLAVFPAGLSLGLLAVFFVVFGLVFDHRGWVVPVVAATVGNALLWLILAPVMARHVRARTCRGIDTLLNNMALAGRTG